MRSQSIKKEYYQESRYPKRNATKSQGIKKERYEESRYPKGTRYQESKYQKKVMRNEKNVLTQPPPNRMT